MNLIDRVHMLHRFWRYRLRDESDYVNFVLKQDLSGKTVIDAGANRGIYSYWFSKKVGERGQVYAFEPQPELGLFLKDVKKTFNLKNLIVENKGLSDQCGAKKLFRPEVGSGIAGFDEKTGYEQIDVDVVCLDEYFQDQKDIKISFIKCDVEGHEFHVFMGAENILRKHKPMLLFECNCTSVKTEKIFSFLVNMGYKGFFYYKQKKMDYMKFDAFASKLRRNNFIFVPE